MTAVDLDFAVFLIVLAASCFTGGFIGAYFTLRLINR